jgi:hypothetical protein
MRWPSNSTARTSEIESTGFLSDSGNGLNHLKTGWMLTGQPRCPDKENPASGTGGVVGLEVKNLVVVQRLQGTKTAFLSGLWIV